MNRRLAGLNDWTIVGGVLRGSFAVTASSCHVLLLPCCCCYCCVHLVDCSVDSDSVPGSNDNIGLKIALGMLLFLLLLLLFLFLCSFALARKDEK